jgi:hypothetical protein
MKTIFRSLLLLTAFTLSSACLLAAPPSQINYQGLLADSNGNTINGNRTLSVKLFNATTGGTPIYEETIGNVRVVNGIYSFQFGAVGNGIASTLTGSENYLAVYVESVEQLPRTKILAVPFALRSADAQTLTTQVVALSSNLTTVQGETAALSSNVRALETQTANLSTNLTALTSQNAGISSNLTTLSS